MMIEFYPFSASSSQDEIGKPLPIQIAEFIAGEIFAKRYKPGDRLKEEKLAERFRTSRAPIREALYLLQIDGLVERVPRRGTVVRGYTEKEVRELYDVRLGLEHLAIDRLAERWNDAAHEKFLTVLKHMSTAIEQQDMVEYSRYNTAFHQLLFKVADSEILWRLYRQLGNPLLALFHISTQQDDQVQQSFEEHEQIVAALHAKQFQRAKNLLTDNVRHGMHRALESRLHSTSRASRKPSLQTKRRESTTGH